MSDIDAIRARASDYANALPVDRLLAVTRSALDVPALLALVDAQAARIDKALAAHYNDEGDGVTQPYCLHDGREWPCPTVRSLTEDTQ